MRISSGAPVRHPVPELSEHDLPTGLEPQETPQSSGDLVAYLRLLFDHSRWLFRVTVYGLLASTLIAFLIPTRYDSTTHLMPPDSNQSGGLAMAAAALSGSAGAGGLGGIAGELLGSKSTSDVFVGILGSRSVQDELIQQFDLKTLYHDKKMEDARKELARRTDISVDRKSQIITIIVTDHVPQRAAAIGQAYVEQLNRLVAELSTSSARRERIFLEQRLIQVTKDLESAEKEFSQFSSKNSAIDIKEQGKAMVDAAAVLQGQLIAAESELEGLRQMYTDNNVRIRAIRARIDELNVQLNKIGGKGEDTSAPSDDPQAALYPSIRRLPLLGVTWADLYRRTRVQEAVFETLTKEYELAKVQEAKEIPVVKVLDPPSVPDKRSFPPRLLVMLLGTALVFVVAVAWIFAKTAWDHTDSDDQRKVLALDVFSAMKANIPQFAHNGSSDHTGASKSWNWTRPDRKGDKPSR